MPSKTLYVCPVHSDIILYEEWEKSKKIKSSAQRARSNQRTVIEISKFNSVSISHKSLRRKKGTVHRGQKNSALNRSLGIPLPKKPKICPKCLIFYYKWECKKKKGKN